MPSTYTVNLGIEKPATGEQSGTWGDTTNINFDILDQAINGCLSLTLASAGTSGSPNTLAISDGATSDGRNKWVEFVDGGDLGATAYVQLTPNDAEKIVFIRNSLSGSRSVILFQGTYDAGRGLEVPAGVDMVVKFSGGGATATTTDIFTKLRATEITTPTLTTDDLTAATADINDGTVEAVIGGTTPKAGTFTTLTANTNLTINATTTVDGVIDDDTMATASATKLATSESIKAYVDSSVGAQDTLSEILENGNTSGANNLIIDSGQALTVNTINETTAGSGVTIDSVLLKDDGVNATNLEITNIKANDGTAAGSIANSTGAVTITSFISNSVDIGGGNIDDTTIGGTTPASGAFTTLAASGQLTVGAQLEVAGPENQPTIRMTDNNFTSDSAVRDGFITVPNWSPSTEEDNLVIKGRTASASTFLVDIGGDSNGLSSGNAATTINFLTSANSTTLNGTTRMSITSSLVDVETDFQVGSSYNMWVDVSTGELGVGTGSPLAQYHFVDNAVTNRYVDGSVAGSGMLLEATDARMQILSRNDGINGSSLILSNDAYSWVIHSIPQVATSYSRALRLGYYTATGSGQDTTNLANYTFHIMPDDAGIVGIGAFDANVQPERTLDLYSDNNWASLRISDAINTSGAKDGMITGRPYTLSQPDVVIANLRTETTVNVIQIGGQNTHTANNFNGGEGVQSATQVDFFTASAINTQASSSDVPRMRIQNDGDIIFYEDGGGVGMFYDASAAAIGLGTAGAPAAGHTLEIKNEAGVGSSTILAIRTSSTSDASILSLGDTSERTQVRGTYGTGGGGNLWLYTDTTGGTLQSRLFVGNQHLVGVGEGSAANFEADVASGSGTNFIVRGQAPALTVSNTTETEGKIRIVDRDDQGQNLTISYNAQTQKGYLQVDADKHMWFHSDGNTYFGPLGETTTAYYDAGNTAQIFPQVAIVGNDAGTKNANSFGIFDFGTGGNTEPELVLGHSTSGTVGDNSTPLVAGNNLGRILWNGSDGSKMANGAFILAEAAGTWTSTTWPSNLIFGVELDSSGPRNAMMVSHDAKVGISDTLNWETNNQVPEELLHLRSTSPYMLIDVYGSESDGGIKFHDGDSGDPAAQAAGIVFDAGSANDLSFRVNDFSTERMKITSAGEIPRPYQPAFRARRTSSININTSLAAGGVVPFDSESVDINSDYNATNYRFTAPVDGTYVFFVALSFSGGDESTDDSIQGYWYTNGSADGNAGMFMNPSYLTKVGVEMVQSGSYLKALSAGDYVEYRLTDVQQTAQLDANSYWGGYLL